MKNFLVVLCCSIIFSASAISQVIRSEDIKVKTAKQELPVTDDRAGELLYDTLGKSLLLPDWVEGTNVDLGAALEDGTYLIYGITLFKTTINAQGKWAFIRDSTGRPIQEHYFHVIKLSSPIFLKGLRTPVEVDKVFKYTPDLLEYLSFYTFYPLKVHQTSVAVRIGIFTVRDGITTIQAKVL